MNFGDKLTYRNTKGTGSWKDSMGDYGIIKCLGNYLSSNKEKSFSMLISFFNILSSSELLLNSIKFTPFFFAFLNYKQFTFLFIKWW